MADKGQLHATAALVIARGLSGLQNILNVMLKNFQRHEEDLNPGRPASHFTGYHNCMIVTSSYFFKFHFDAKHQ
jgi:hypothetical protein